MDSTESRKTSRRKPITYGKSSREHTLNYNLTPQVPSPTPCLSDPEKLVRRPVSENFIPSETYDAGLTEQAKAHCGNADVCQQRRLLPTPELSKTLASGSRYCITKWEKTDSVYDVPLSDEEKRRTPEPFRKRIKRDP